MGDQRDIEDDYAGNDYVEAVFDALAAVRRWLMLVVAIALGTCLGIWLFVKLMLHQVEDEMHQINFGPTTTMTFHWPSP